MKPKPFPFQKEVIDEIDGFKGRTLCALPMGLGKTLISLWWLEKHPEAFPVLIVCPTSLKYMWQHEAKRILGIDSKILYGKTPYVLEKWNIYIINYDVIQYWLPILESISFNTLILEESHACKNPKTTRTKACKKIAKKIPYVLALSGTPLTNRPIELFPVLNILRPATFNSFWNFGTRYCGGRKSYWGWEYKGATRTEELNTLLKCTCMSRRIKSEVLKDLPDKNRCILPIPLRNPEEYEEADENFILWLAKQNPTKAKRALSAEAVVKLGYLKRLAAKLKAKYVVRWVNQWLRENEEEKLVLFAEHKAMVKVLASRCKAKFVVVEGKTSAKKRRAYEQQFQEDESTRLFIGNRRVGGIGLTLTAASTLAFTEMDWVPGNMIQAEDRIHRIGQTNVSWIYYFVGINTIEEKLCSILQSKQRVLDAVLDGGTLVENFDVYDKLLKYYKRQVK
jgi:SWI/SNF-related matrix-associated actin-dependent regulator 1 of chromatin subfamily A